MTITETRVNGKRFESFEHIPAAEETTARRLLAYDDAVDAADLFTSHLDVWIRAHKMNWTAPAGWQIEKVSNFDGGTACITLVEVSR